MAERQNRINELKERLQTLMNMEMGLFRSSRQIATL